MRYISSMTVLTVLIFAWARGRLNGHLPEILSVPSTPLLPTYPLTPNLPTTLFIPAHSSPLPSPPNSPPTSNTLTTPLAPPTPTLFPSFSSHVTWFNPLAKYPPPCTAFLLTSGCARQTGISVSTVRSQTSTLPPPSTRAKTPGRCGDQRAQ